MTNIYLEKIAEMQKVAGNRLVQYISENRKDFPLSRLMGLVDKGVLKSPEQLVPGRNLGSLNQLDALTKRHKLSIQGVAAQPSVNLPANVATIRRGLYNDGGFSASGMSMDGRSKFQQLSIPALRPAVPGDVSANIRQLHDTHISNHEAFEMDEAFRAMKEGRLDLNLDTRTMIPGRNFTVAGHNNAAVLLRESRDMSSNPYAHISPTSTNFRENKRLTGLSKKTGMDFQDTIEKNRAVPLDVSSALPTVRVAGKEDKLVSKMMGGRPYTSNPTSSEISRARRLPEGEAQRQLDEIKGRESGRINTLVAKARFLHDAIRGNSSFRN